MNVSAKFVIAASMAAVASGCQSTGDLALESSPSAVEQAQLSTDTIPLIEVDALSFRDLNRNGALDMYEDWRVSPSQRARDLVARMTVEEKVGQMAHASLIPDQPFGTPPTGYNMGFANMAILQNKVTAFVGLLSLRFDEFAEQNNAIQSIAERNRLGIPVTMSTDPRHHFQSLVGASSSGEGYSQWPEPLGFAALNDAEIMEQFGQIAAQEYRATGWNQALSPQADLATEPRWTRIYHTFGENPEIAGAMAAAYVRGFQGGADGVRPGHVPTVVKHWVGYGAAKDGWDSHNYYGRFGDLQEEDLAAHIAPFVAAFEAGANGVMPAYSVFEGLTVNGQPVEPVGAGYSSVLIDGLLRKDYQFDGMVLSDWAITADCNEVCREGAAPGAFPNPQTDISTGWGVQDLTMPERFALAINAGIDQFGNVLDPRPIVAALEQGLISEQQIDASVERVLTKSIASGIFEAPFVDVEAAREIVNSRETQALALKTQARSMVWLDKVAPGPVLAPGAKVFVYGAEPEAFTKHGFTVVAEAAEADAAVVRLKTPFEKLHPGYFFGSKQHEGRLDFAEDSEEMALLRSLEQADVPIIVDIFLDRPAVLTNVASLADGLIANFGASDQALISVLDGSVIPEGRLPIELPSSMQAVEEQSSGKPADSIKPLFPVGFFDGKN